MKALAKMEKLEFCVNDLDLRIEVLEAKCCSQDKSTGELKQVRLLSIKNLKTTRLCLVEKP